MSRTHKDPHFDRTSGDRAAENREHKRIRREEREQLRFGFLADPIIRRVRKWKYGNGSNLRYR